MAGGMILEEKLSISFGHEADHLLPQNIGHCVLNIFEFTESQNNLDCKGIIILCSQGLNTSKAVDSTTWATHSSA